MRLSLSSKAKVNFIAQLDCNHTFQSTVKITKGDLVPCVACGWNAYRFVLEVQYKDGRAANRPPNLYGRPKKRAKDQPNG